MLKKANKKNCSKIRGNLMFLPVKKFAHDNFFYKITTKKLRKFAIFHVFCKTVRKIAGKNHIFTALFRLWNIIFFINFLHTNPGDTFLFFPLATSERLFNPPSLPSPVAEKIFSESCQSEPNFGLD